MKKIIITFYFLLFILLSQAQVGTAVQTTQTFTFDVQKLFDKTPPNVRVITNPVPIGREFKVSFINEKNDTGSITKSGIFKIEGTEIPLADTVFNNNLKIEGNSSMSFKIIYSSNDTLKLLFFPETLENDTATKTPSFVVFSFIKSLAGSEVRDELLDIFLKINYGEHKRSFSLFGADAGINASKKDSASSLLRLNEAMANINAVIFTQKSKYRTPLKRKINAEKQDKALPGFDPSSYSTNGWTRIERQRLRQYLKDTATLDRFSRVGFIGTGLKVFYMNPYVGAHIGIMETKTTNKLMGSYFMVGYYYSPYLDKVRTQPVNDSARFYRNNIYFEAGLNGFGDVPSVVKFVRFKFGLMLPFKAGKDGHGDTERPKTTDAVYRLAVEVPIGGAIKF